jgi:glutamyl/glutaminyl-tRNA synthetase
MSFFYTAQLAKAANAGLLLRIDDMDAERTRPEYVQDIFDTFALLNIVPSIGPATVTEHSAAYAQQHRMPLYEKTLTALADTGLVYACTCSRKALEQEGGNCACKGQAATLTTKDVAWRIQVPPGTVIDFYDAVLGHVQVDLHRELKSFIVKRKEGIPAYQVTSLSDDMFFNVTDIVRGQDLLTSTAMQLYLARLLAYEPFLNSVFYHHPLIVNSTGEKLSKSAGDISIHEMRKQLTREEMLNMMHDLLTQHNLL